MEKKINPNLGSVRTERYNQMLELFASERVGREARKYCVCAFVIGFLTVFGHKMASHT